MQSNFYQLRQCISILLLLMGFSNYFVNKVQAGSYLKEAPTFLIPCSISDPKNGLCFARAIENIFTNWKNGIPGLESIGSIDPLHVKKIHFVQNSQNINLKLDLKDIELSGLSQTKVNKAIINDAYDFKILVKVPSLRSKADYRLKGTLLLLNLDSTGSMESEISDLEVSFSIKTKLLTANSKKFFDINSIQSSIKNIADFHINFDNLFGHSTELSKSANDVFNQNWRQVFEVMRPSIEETLSTIIIDRYKKIFNYVPADYFFVDLP